MAQSLDALRASLSTEERAEVEAEKARMRAEIHALRRLRMARDMTQTQLAEVLGMTQGELSRLEARSDIMLSTLRPRDPRNGRENGDPRSFRRRRRRRRTRAHIAGSRERRESRFASQAHTAQASKVHGSVSAATFRRSRRRAYQGWALIRDLRGLLCSCNARCSNPRYALFPRSSGDNQKTAPS